MTAVAMQKNDALFTIGSFQAKTYFAELLRKVEAGETVMITRNGHDVAVMQSPRKKAAGRAEEAWSRLMKISAQISETDSRSRRTGAVDASRRADSSVSISDINKWKEAGRR